MEDSDPSAADANAAVRRELKAVLGEWGLVALRAVASVVAVLFGLSFLGTATGALSIVVVPFLLALAALCFYAGGRGLYATWRYVSGSD